MGHSKLPWKVTKLSHANDQLWLQITGPDGRGPIVRVNSPGEPMADGVIAESKYLVTPEDNQLANANLIITAVNVMPEVKRILRCVVDKVIDSPIRQSCQNSSASTPITSNRLAPSWTTSWEKKLAN